MNTSMAGRFVAAVVAIGVIAGCAGGSQVAPTPVAAVSSAASGNAAGTRTSISPSGRFLRNGARARREAPVPNLRIPKGPRDLYVALASNVAVLQNKSWGQVGSLAATGMACPDGDWIDKKGNLYVADWDCGGSGNVPGVYEFERGANQPSFTYTAGLSDPTNVTTDRHGNVFVMDFFGGYLDEYKQGSNSPLYQCAPPSGYGLVASAAVDRHGNVFMASMNDASPWTTYLYEYAGGLKGCSATQLATFPFFPGGMVLDKNQNLIIADQVDDVVDVIAPPYSTIASQISAVDPGMVSINKKNDRLYVGGYVDGDEANGEVYVDAYPSGANIATLGASNGITSDVGGAVDTQNYIP